MRTPQVRLSQLDTALQGAGRILLTTHNNPDPDGICAAILLKKLLFDRFSLRCAIAYGGVVGRAENKALIRYSRQRFGRYTTALEKRYRCVALVDTQPGAGNNPVRSVEKVRVVFDHHKIRVVTRTTAFHEVRSEAGTTSSIVYLYLKEAGIGLDRRMATAMVYALWSETAEFQREASKLDLEAYNELFPLVDQRALFSIRNAKLEGDHFSAVKSGIDRGLLYGNVLVIDLGQLAYPDVAAEVADYFLRYRPVSYTFVMGTFEGELLFSVRSDRRDARLGEVAGAVTQGMGTAGGHGTMAGGQIELLDGSKEAQKRVREELVSRFLSVLGVSRRIPLRMVDAIGGSRSMER